MKNIQNCFHLNNGAKIPCMGLGAWRISNDKEGTDIVKTAIECGYRHIDTAALYHNEKAVGNAVRSCGLPRNELFITSKLGNNDHGYKNTLTAFDKTMNELKIEYLDLYLIHWPKPYSIRDRWAEMNAETWQAFEELYNKGLIKAIGVSNFLKHHLEALERTAKIEPMVNQLEMHPCYFQTEIYNYCGQRGIIVEAWSPLMAGRAFDMPLLIEIAGKYNKSVSQICLRWSFEKGLLPLPKSSKKERMIENADIFDFELSGEDMERIKSLQNIGRVGAHPDTASF